MEDKTPSPRHRRSRVLAVGVAGAIVLGIAGPVGALLPAFDDAGYQPGGGYGTELDTGTEYNLPPGEDNTGWNSDNAAAPADPANPSELANPATPDESADPAAQAAKTAEQLQKETKDAIDGALSALRKGQCADFIGKTASGETSLQIMESLAAADHPAGKGRVNDDANVEGKTADGRPAAALAEDATNPRASGTGKGSGGTIHVFKQFHDLDLSKSPAFYNAASSPDGRQYVLTQAQGRVLLLLHELMHLTGALDAGHTTIDPGNVDLWLSEQREVHERIIASCVPDARRENRPAGSRSGGGDGGSGGSGDDAAVVVPPIGDGGSGSAPLPESDYPVIDFDNPYGSDPVITGDDGTVIDGGYYSDDPVITGEDGTVIDGGEVGPYPDSGGGGGTEDDFDWYWIEAEEYAY